MNTKIQRLICASIILILLFALTMLVAVGGDADNYDYSHASEGVNYIDSAELAEEYLLELGEMLSDRERAFLKDYSNLTVKYSPLIPTNQIDIAYDLDSSSLSITAKVYEYMTESGMVTWTPVSAQFMGRELLFTDGGYVLTFDNVTSENKSGEVSVKYSLNMEIDATALSDTVNLYYNVAKYSRDFAEYEGMMAAYEEYLLAKRLYEESLERYEKYLAEREEYEKTLYLYENYSEALLQYERDYELYQQYLAEYEVYLQEYEEYSGYKDVIELINHQLLALDIAKIPMTDKRDVYNVIFGNTVDSVLENKSLIESSAVGADPAVIDLAGVSTDNIRGYFREYFKLKTVEQKYSYYTVNYDALCSNFRNLTASLDNLYSNRKVRAMLIAEGKNRKYVILLAQLALITDSLIDGDVYDLSGRVAFGPDWIIDGQSRDSILENKTYIVDTDNSVPISGGLPPYMTSPVPPIEVVRPTLPVRPAYPIEPTPVLSPGAVPRPMPQPVMPVAGERTLAIYNSLSDALREELSALFNSGNIPSFRTLNSSWSPKRYSTVCDCFGDARASVNFYNTDGTLISSHSVRRGSAVQFVDAYPTKEADSEYEKYRFTGWVDEWGETVSLLCIDSDVNLYPKFEGVKKIYSVRWNMGDAVVTTTHEAGSIPAPPAVTPYLSPDGLYTYEFSGSWDRTIQPIYADCEYSALFNREYTVPTSSGGGAISDDGSQVTLDIYGAADEHYDISRLIARIAGKRSLLVNATNAKLYFSFSDIMGMKNIGVRYIGISVLKSGGSAYAYAVELMDYEMKPIVNSNIDISVTVPGLNAGGTNVVMYTEHMGEREYIRYTRDGANVVFTAAAGRSYTLAHEVRIYATDTSMAKIQLSCTVARPGDRVQVGCMASDGVIVEKITVSTLSGAKIELGSDGYFVMPAEDVQVSADTRYKIYTVSFAVGERIIATMKMKYGDIPIPPAPQKASDGIYSYSFLGWSSEVVAVRCDVTYVAVFESVLLPPKPPQSGLIIQPQVMRILLLGASAVIMLLLVIIPSSIVSIVFLVRRRRRRLK